MHYSIDVCRTVLKHSDGVSCTAIQWHHNTTNKSTVPNHVVQPIPEPMTHTRWFFLVNQIHTAYNLHEVNIYDNKIIT